MRNLLVLGIGLIAMFGVRPTAMAQDGKGEVKVTMDEVVVTASRQAEKITRVPSHVSVVTAHDIENSTAANVAEILSTLPGIHVSDISGNKRNYSVDLRGFGESTKQNILLLVDGRRVNLDDLSGADWNLIPLDRIARIEIIRGSRGTVLYGDNATAGVINIITKEGAKSGGTATLAYGSYSTLKGHAAVNGAGDTMAYDITGSYLQSDGYRDNSDTISKDIGANLRLDPSDRLRVHLSTGYHYDDTRNPGRIFKSELDAGTSRTDTLTPDDFDKVHDYYIKMGLEIDLMSDHFFKLEASTRDREKESFGTFSGGFFDSDTQTSILTASPQLVLKHDTDKIANRMIVGVDFIKSKQDFDNVSEFFGSPTQILATLEKFDSAYYVHDELGIGQHLSLSGGYRNDRATFSYAPSTPGKKTLDEESHSVGINYTFSDKSHVYGSYTRSFRYPVLDEQFSYFFSTIDTTLAPQTTDNYEIGASVEILNHLVAGVNFFLSETEDEIFYNVDSFANENMEGTTVRQGAEFSLAWQSRSLSLGATYTYTDTEYDGGPNDGKEVPFVPVDKATAKASYTFGCGLTLGFDAVYIGESFLISDFEQNEKDKFPEADAYTVVNAKLQYDWHGFTFFANLNNLFNEEYNAYNVVGFNPTTFENAPSYYPSPEFNALLGVKAYFGTP
jgi:iron complex outermembrane recepter protein